MIQSILTVYAYTKGIFFFFFFIFLTYVIIAQLLQLIMVL